MNTRINEKQMPRYGIITPTFKDHFCYISKYLQSASKNIVDKEDVLFIFTISRDERLDFNKIIRNYEDDLNIKVYYFEQLLKKNNIEGKPSYLLDKYGKYSYQTLKKFYTMLERDCKKYLVLDSESMWMRSVRIDEIFKSYFRNPYLCGSVLESDNMSEFTYGVMNNADFILEFKCDYWFLETFTWFYEINILDDMFARYGTPYQIIQRVYNRNGKDPGVFEIILYSNYIYINRERYGYKIINVAEELKQYLDDRLFQGYMEQYYEEYEGNCGLIERVMSLLNVENINPLICMLKDLNIGIIRSDCSLKMLRIQKEFYDNMKPFVLAASQDHFFGENASKKYLADYILSRVRRKRKIWQRECVHQILYRISPAYRSNCHINATLIRMEHTMNQFLSDCEKIIEDRGYTDMGGGNFK